MLFSAFFLVLANSAGNSIAFAKQILLIALPQAGKTSDLDARLVRFIAIVILTVICLLHYFSGKLGRFMNKLLALFKGCLLFSVFVAGVKAAHKEGSGLKDFTQKHDSGSGINSLAALVLILYSYQGWENANYVRRTL